MFGLWLADDCSLIVAGQFVILMHLVMVHYLVGLCVLLLFGGRLMLMQDFYDLMDHYSSRANAT